MTDNIVPHSWRTEANCIVYVEEMVLINHYNVEVGFDTSTANPILHDIAFEKMEMFFEVILPNSIIIAKKDFDNRPDLKNNFIQLPNMLNDQTFGSTIYSKLIAMLGEDMQIDYIKLSSSLGKNIIYTINENSPEFHVLLPDKEEWWGSDDSKYQPWWRRPDPATYDELLSEDEIYQGEFTWEEHFENEIEEAKTLDSKKTKFELIRGGKDEVKSPK